MDQGRGSERTPDDGAASREGAVQVSTRRGRPVGRNMDPTRWLVRFDPQASRAGLSVRGAANVDGPSLESIVTALTDHGPEPPGSEGRDGAARAGAIVAGLPAFRAVGHRAVP